MKTYQLIIITAAILFVGFLGYHPSQPVQTPLGAAVSAPLYYSATNTSVACPSATSTTLLAGGTARSYFAAVNNDASNQIYVCKGSSCSVNTGVRLNAAGGSYEQFISQDGYTGIYSCIAATATSTLTITYAQ